MQTVQGFLFNWNNSALFRFLPQLRLRHLRSISVRNIVPKFAISGDCLLDCLLETYFTLHSVRGSQEGMSGMYSTIKKGI